MKTNNLFCYVFFFDFFFSEIEFMNMYIVTFVSVPLLMYYLHKLFETNKNSTLIWIKYILFLLVKSQNINLDVKSMFNIFFSVVLTNSMFIKSFHI
jgi:hypothetical protein